MNIWWNVYLYRYNWVLNEMFIIMILFVKFLRLIDFNIYINIVYYLCKFNLNKLLRYICVCVL